MTTGAEIMPEQAPIPEPKIPVEPEKEKLDTVVEEALKIPSKLILKRPVEIDGKNLKELNMDFASMKGREIFQIEESFYRKFGSTDMPDASMDRRFQMMMVAKLNGITVEGLQLNDMDGEDAIAMRMMTAAFFRTAGMGRMRVC